MTERYSELWGYVLQYYTLRSQIKATRNELYRYTPSSYKGREISRNLEHTSRIMSRLFEQLKCSRMLDSFDEIKKELDSFQHYEIEKSETMVEVVTYIVQMFNRRDRWNAYPVFLTQKHISSYNPNKENTFTMTIGEGSTHIFQIEPFKWLDRRAIIDDILMDLQ